MGTELSDKGCCLLRKPQLDADPGCRSAAMAAARAAWQVAWKLEISAKATAIYQAMKKLSHGRFCPPLLVDEVVAFSVEVPKIIKDLDLWDDAEAWGFDPFLRSPTSQVEKNLQNAGSSGHVEHPQNEELDAEDPQEPHMTPSSQEAQPSSQEAPQDTFHADPDGAVDEKATDELMLAMRASRNDVPPLNMHGVRLFRLNGFANAQHVIDLLFNPHGPLKSLHDRIREAGCRISAAENAILPKAFDLTIQRFFRPKTTPCLQHPLPMTEHDTNNHILLSGFLGRVRP